MRVAALFLLTFVLVSLVTGCREEHALESDETKIFTGPRFWIGEPTRPWADGLLVRQGRIERLLSAEEIAPAAAPGATIHRLAGAVAVPGLVDAHAHILSYGLTLSRVDLVGAKSLQQALERVRDYAAAHAGDGWIRGRGWDQNDWPAAAWPDADALEEVTGARPCVLSRIDGHALWLNRSALEQAGIDASTADPPGGQILRDGKGRPTGILIDNAEQLVNRVLPPLTPDEIDEALEAAGEALVSAGLTGVHDMGIDEATWAAMQRLAAEDRFHLRVHAYASSSGPLRELIGEQGPLWSRHLALLGPKLFADGALGSRGARLLEDYDDAPGQRGLWVTSPEKLEEEIRRALDEGLQPAIHAIGDAANRAVIEILEREHARRGGWGQLPPRLEHAQILAPSDISRASRLGIVISMQPTHATSDMPWAKDRIGSARLAGAYAWRSFLDAGALLAFGSDFPVESIDPRLGLYAAVTREDLEGKPPGGWRATERLELDQALRAFSAGAARAVGEENSSGRIAPGYDCDLTVLARDPFELDPAELPRTGISATVIAGRVFYPKSPR